MSATTAPKRGPLSSRLARRGALSLLALGALVALAGFARADWEQVLVDVPIPPRIETKPGERVLVTLFRTNDHPRFYPGLEIARWTRREITNDTELVVVDVPPPPIPEQRPERLAENAPFWRQLGEDFDADIIIAGIGNYAVEDRSGFVTEDRRDPYTGQTIRRTVYSERVAFSMQLDVFFFKGSNGALLHTDSWFDERIMLDEGAIEDLQMLYDILGTMSDDLRAVLLPTKQREPRFIWTE